MQVNGEILNAKRVVGFSKSMSKYKTNHGNRLFDDIIKNSYKNEDKEVDR